MSADSHFELLDHPADIGFRATAGSLEALFATSAVALVSLILDPTNIIDSQQIELRASGRDLASLLVNWLNEVLYWVDSRRLALHNFHVGFPDDHEIRATAAGEPRSSGRHGSGVVVKGVTYHQLRIANEDSKWTAEVYVDV
ncbi:MAG: archease [Acidobacteriaceae bacterium]|nr:archease [Acidobacteriaceae bacterium]